MTVPFAVEHAGFGGTRQVVSALGITNGEVPSPDHKSWPMKARPLLDAPSGLVATSCTNWAQVLKPNSVAVAGLLKRIMSPLSRNPTNRSPKGLMANPLGVVPAEGKGQPLPPRKAPFLALAPPPRVKALFKSRAP